MNHKNFEEWLFAYLDGDSLETEQSAQLQGHLQTCETCQNLAKSWREVDQHLMSAQMVAPKPGFVNRWLERIEIDKRQLQRRQTAAALVFTLCGAAVLFGSLILIVWPWFSVPELFLFNWVSSFFLLMDFLEPVNRLILILMQIFTTNMSLFWWIFFVGLLSELAVLWLVSFRWLTNPRRVMVDETTY